MSFKLTGVFLGQIMNTKEKNGNNLHFLSEETEKRDTFTRSNTSKKYLTIIDQDFYQKSNLSLEAMGLIGYLMSMPEDWVVYNLQLQSYFKIGRDKLRNIIRELCLAGYMQRTARQDSKGKMTGWITKYSDIPEFQEHHRLTEKPTVGSTDCRKIRTYKINNKTIIKNNNNKPKKTKKTNKQENVVVVSLVKTLEDLAISQTLVDTWVKEYGVDYVNEKIDLMRASNPKNPEGYLNHAITHDWQPAAPKPKAATTEPVEPQYPTHDENVAWYQSLSNDEKLTHYQTAARHHVAFEHMLTQQKLSVLDTTFTQNTFFKMMMSLIGRAP